MIFGESNLNAAPLIADPTGILAGTEYLYPGSSWFSSTINNPVIERMPLDCVWIGRLRPLLSTLFHLSDAIHLIKTSVAIFFSETLVVFHLTVMQYIHKVACVVSSYSVCVY
jgi:hypothetical protein